MEIKSYIVVIVSLFIWSCQPKNQTNPSVSIATLSHDIQDSSGAISYQELQSVLAGNLTDAQLIDLRPEQIYKKSHLNLALNIPLTKLLDRKFKKTLLTSEKTFWLYSKTPAEAHAAWMILKSIGLSNVKYLTWGYEEIQKGQMLSTDIEEAGYAYGTMWSDLKDTAKLVVPDVAAQSEPKQIILKKKKKKAEEEEEGC